MAVLVAIGTVIGFLAGRGYQVAARAWVDYKKTKAAVPEMLKLFWAAARAAIVVAMVALVWMTATVWIGASGA
jgi:hypothetical protein